MSNQKLREMAADWSSAIYQLAEQVRVNIEPLKENYVCELCAVGLHKLAQEVNIVVILIIFLSSTDLSDSGLHIF